MQNFRPPSNLQDQNPGVETQAPVLTSPLGDFDGQSSVKTTGLWNAGAGNGHRDPNVKMGYLD